MKHIKEGLNAPEKNLNSFPESAFTYIFLLLLCLPLTCGITGRSNNKQGLPTYLAFPLGELLGRLGGPLPLFFALLAYKNITKTIPDV
jgi:hypothetical protein